MPETRTARPYKERRRTAGSSSAATATPCSTIAWTGKSIRPLNLDGTAACTTLLRCEFGRRLPPACSSCFSWRTVSLSGYISPNSASTSSYSTSSPLLSTSSPRFAASSLSSFGRPLPTKPTTGRRPPGHRPTRRVCMPTKNRKTRASKSTHRPTRHFSTHTLLPLLYCRSNFHNLVDVDLSRSSLFITCRRRAQTSGLQPSTSTS
mmetsp:Transcript_3588/g.11014  ORF Transcript_3588/g.11014 Transcript_3588/m.11014 type:complete len:206 (+) Transcript_3588:1658-2275(+)